MTANSGLSTTKPQDERKTSYARFAAAAKVVIEQPPRAARADNFLWTGLELAQLIFDAILGDALGFGWKTNA